MPYADPNSEIALRYRETYARRRRDQRLGEEVLGIIAAGPGEVQKFTRICVSLLSERLSQKKRRDADRTSKYRKSRPGYALAAMRRFKYGLSSSDLDARKESQNHGCGLCGDSLGNRFHVDHDHTTGKVRGLLCGGCNTGLGHFKDCPTRCEQAAAYLRRNQ